MTEECQELRLHCETLTSSIKTAELDSKAGRETILRLVSEAKKHESGRGEARELKGEVERMRGEVEQQRGALMASEQERVGMGERLTAAKETMVALQRQLEAKEQKWVLLSAVFFVKQVTPTLQSCHLSVASSPFVKSLSLSLSDPG